MIWNIVVSYPYTRLTHLNQSSLDENVKTNSMSLMLKIGVPEFTPPSTPVSTTIWLTESINRVLRKQIRQKKTIKFIENLIKKE